MRRMFNDTSSVQSLLATRRSGKPRDMVAPGPDANQLRTILTAAIRVPDHGKLAPWRFLIIGNEQREALAAIVRRAFLAEKPGAHPAEIDAANRFAFEAPTLVVALSVPNYESKIPVWEQEMSAGAAVMNALIAAHALGFVASWITGWPAYNAEVGAAFGIKGARVAGFIFIGSASRPLEERPRPQYDDVIANWTIPQT